MLLALRVEDVPEGRAVSVFYHHPLHASTAVVTSQSSIMFVEMNDLSFSSLTGISEPSSSHLNRRLAAHLVLAKLY